MIIVELKLILLMVMLSHDSHMTYLFMLKMKTVLFLHVQDKKMYGSFPQLQ